MPPPPLSRRNETKLAGKGEALLVAVNGNYWIGREANRTGAEHSDAFTAPDRQRVDHGQRIAAIEAREAKVQFPELPAMRRAAGPAVSAAAARLVGEHDI